MPEAGFDLGAAVAQVGRPAGITDWVQLVGVLAFGLIGGLFVAAVSAAKSGAAGTVTDEEPAESPASP